MRPPIRVSLSMMLLVSLGCGGGTGRAAGATAIPPDEPSEIVRVPLGLAQDHFHTVPVRVGADVETTFILDTGIGIALVSRALCERIGCVVSGSFEGQRMSGQSVEIPLTTIPAIALGAYVQRDVVAGVIDIEGFFPEPHVEGFLGLPFFSSAAFTIDAQAQALIVESDATLAARAAAGTSLPVRLDVHGPAVDAFAELVLPSGERASVLLDTGSRLMTLHPRYAPGLGVALEEGPNVRVREGQDETGYTYRRYFTTLEGESAFAAAPGLPRGQLDVMFQEIIHDGLVGTQLMSSFVMTFDIARSRVIVLAPREGDRPASSVALEAPPSARR